MFTLGNMGVMICLGQGGLPSPSASIFFLIYFFNLFFLVGVGEGGGHIFGIEQY